MDTTLSNHINQGSYKIEEKEQQLYRAVKEKEREFLHLIYYKFNQAKDFQPVELSFNELLENLSIDARHTSYIKGLIQNMAGLTTTFNEPNSKSFVTYPIFREFRLCDEQKKVTVEFNDKLIDYLYSDSDIKLIKKWSEYKKNKRTLIASEVKEIKPKHKGNYTITNHIDITLLRSAYAMELYEKLSQFKTYEKEKKYTMNEFRELLNIPKSYTPSMIKLKILELSKKQINENTSLEIDYEIEGTMKRQSIIFKVKSKEKKTKKSTSQKEKKLDSEIEAQFLESSSGSDDSENGSGIEKLSPEILRFREEAKELGKKKITHARYFEFLAQLIPAKTIKDIEKLCEEFGILEKVENQVNGTNGVDE